MTTMSLELAARIVIVYEGKLPLDGRADLPTRIEAMRQTVEELKLGSGRVSSGEPGEMRQLLRR